jgi:hypothetical protein
MSDILSQTIDAELAAELRKPRGRVSGGIALLAEARRVAAWAERVHAPVEAESGRKPGLSDAGLRAEVPDEIRQIVDRIERVDVALLPRKTVFPTRRVISLAHDLLTAVAWALREDAEVTRTAAALRKRVRGAKGHAAHVTVLSEVLVLVEPREATLRAQPAFDGAVLDEARGLVAAHARGVDDSRAVQRAVRAALVEMLRRRIRDVRAATRIAFRRRPDLAAQAPVTRRRRPTAVTPAEA